MSMVLGWGKRRIIGIHRREDPPISTKIRIPGTYIVYMCITELLVEQKNYFSAEVEII